MPLTLTYTAKTSVPVEIEGLTPDALQGKTLDEIRRFPVFHGKQKVPLAELFDVEGDVEGDPAGMEWHFEGDLSGVLWLGAHLKEGSIEVHGPAGRHLGSQMEGGSIWVHGSAGDWLGGQMRGGQIRVDGRAADHVGAAFPGSRVGMTGGTLLIGGDVGHDVGHKMRRGSIVVGGSCGEMLGHRLLAGTIFVFGQCGPLPGAGMRRGTIGLFGPNRPELLPTFRHACRYRPTTLKLLLQQLRKLDFQFDHSLCCNEVDLWNGDLLEEGRGEIWLGTRT